MKRFSMAVAFGILALPCLAPAPPAQAAGEAKAAPTAPTMSATDLRNGMRKLWTDHTTYTRAYIVSALAALPDLPTVTQRLLRNQDDIGAAIKPIYGEEAGKKLAALLRDHIMIAAEITKAAKASDTKGVEGQGRQHVKRCDMRPVEPGHCHCLSNGVLGGFREINRA